MSKTLVNNNPGDRNTDATVHIGQLDDRVTEDLLWELMVQAGPVKHVYVPRDRITGKHFGYGFCEFHSELDAAYATRILNMINLFSKPIRLAQSSLDRHPHDVGANLFVGNLAPSVDEKLLYDAFSAFGTILETPHVMREPESDLSKGYGFVKYTTFEASDNAVATMNGQYICNRSIVVQYAFKKDSDGRERHGSQAERLIAQAGSRAKSLSLDERFRPHTMFSDKPASRKTDHRSPVASHTGPPQSSTPNMPPPPHPFSQFGSYPFYQPQITMPSYATYPLYQPYAPYPQQPLAPMGAPMNVSTAYQRFQPAAMAASGPPFSSQHMPNQHSSMRSAPFRPKPSSYRQNVGGNVPTHSTGAGAEQSVGQNTAPVSDTVNPENKEPPSAKMTTDT